MPTYAQLQAEPWWGREIVTPELDWLGDELCRRTGRPRTAAGSKGDNRHLRGAHRSQEWILHSAYCTSRTYTVQSGLTATQARHIAGIDFVPGSAEQMIAQCKRLMAAVKGGRLDEVRELYGNVDGDQVVDGWDNVRDRASTSDSSHLWHWHLTIDRRRCADRALMERILAIALGEDDDMGLSNDPLVGGRTERQAVADLWWAEFRGNTLSVEQQSLARVEAQLAGMTELVRQVLALPGSPLTAEQVEQVAVRTEAAARSAVDDLAVRLAEADRARAAALATTQG